MRVSRFVLCLLVLFCALTRGRAQQTETRVALTEAATAMDAKGAPAIEAKLLTAVLNGSPESPVTNVRLVLKNTATITFNYVSGWATFYDQGGVRCGEGMFKIDALAPGESAETDTPGLRLRCNPATWRVMATHLLTRANEDTKPAESSSSDRAAPANFVISIDGEEHPIQINNPMVLKLGSRDAKIVLRPAP